ncbi:hypothetical protein MLD38_007083 [Melastoma candidum]|uniref:Uncharacterized protein n=1 Tax=Melastoma candidum TaxID=119954 RepID=A0ACB9RR75_9MYRT|nr:hypothetical protein MLD38_007083 [Melastoma candidum]
MLSGRYREGLGAGLVNLETGATLWISRSLTAVLVVKLHGSRVLAFCRCRNTSILAIDIRQRPASMRQTFQRFPFPSTNPVPVNDSRPRTQWFKVKGTLPPDWMERMSRSIASLVSLWEARPVLPSELHGQIDQSLPSLRRY